MRIGHGYDVHAFSDIVDGGADIVLGGVRIPFDRELIAHSDGDVLLHALCDALLGAAALGDIGSHFPDTDPAYRGADSRVLLREVYSKVRAQGFLLCNADMTIVAQAPKMAPYLAAMIDNIAADLDCSARQLNIKATTTEKLGFVGRKEGLACEAVVLLSQADFQQPDQ